MQRLIAVLATTAAIFHLWAAGVSPFTALVQRPVHLALMAAVGLLGVGLLEREREDRDSRAVGMAISWILTLATAAVCVYVATQHAELVQRSGSPTTSDLIAGAVAILAVASAFMGSLSGSAVANVVTTGAFTIPLMRRAGFRPYFAGAIEAAASTGGQLMPPVMGAGAFILATWTSIPYVEVALAALVPAILYYGALLMAIHFRAWKMDLKPAQHATSEPVLPRLHLLFPLAVIVVLLGIGSSPMRAAFWGVVSGGVLALVRPETRLTFDEARDALVAAARGTVIVAAACAAAGIVVGVASLTGIGLRMSELIGTLSGGNLFIALLLTAAGSIVLGMGLPTTAAYVVLAALGAPALVELGVPLLGAHLFIFYFGCISNVTPRSRSRRTPLRASPELRPYGPRSRR